ncbi:MAG: hypothetical protein LBC63_08485 [Holophagales bacterium]|jgi:hypothetical protein|nr:hypothetical protein [Holophagales bacterium]
MTSNADAHDMQLAESLLKAEARWLKGFSAEDPFNGNKCLRGFICQEPNYRYGALALTHVDGAEAPQAIFATPKLHYPLSRDGAFHFPPAVKQILMYDKLDGTNVLAYRYHDAAGKPHVTYKLRLSPVLRNSKWGPFFDMWQELIEKHPAIPKLAERNDCSVSFEMYGRLNTHLIVYEEPLAAAVLFGVRADGSVVPPGQLDLMGVPSAKLIGQLEAGQDPVANYAEMRESMEKRNRPAEGDKISGTEGAVWYVETPRGRVTMWKCKPESVETIHWAASITKEAVRATCWNYLETGDDLTYDALLPMLLEEYQIAEIRKFRESIEICIKQVRDELELKERALALYDSLGLSITKDKIAAMRALSQHFRKQDMRDVYNAIIGSRSDT